MPCIIFIVIKDIKMKELIEEIFIDAWAINDIITVIRIKSRLPDLFQIVSGYDLSKPTNKIPFKVYVELCSWIEKKLGQFNLIKIGRRIGESTYSLMLETNMVNTESKPLDVMKALVLLAQKGVKDPKRRGWEIVSHTDKSIQMRKPNYLTRIFRWVARYPRENARCMGSG